MAGGMFIRRQLESTPSDPYPVPTTSGTYVVNSSVINALPIPGTKVLRALHYGESLWGMAAKIIIQLPGGATENYFLKVVTLGEVGRQMCEGEFESLTAIYAVSPGSVPKVHAWGKFDATEADKEGIYFLLEEFRDIKVQPADPVKLATLLAELHQRSTSPTGKFGFHISTCHAKMPQAVGTWEDSWCTLFSNHLRQTMDLARPILQWPEFDIVCRLTLEKVVPRLLLPLQSEGRILKPSLLHGDCWDGNTATDMNTGKAFVFDVCSFYGHNEYDTGNWRTPRHRLSKLAYIENYKKLLPASEPAEDWDARNILYSLTFNICNTIYIPGSTQKQVIYDDMTMLCNMFCPSDLQREMGALYTSQNKVSHLKNSIGEVGRDDEDVERT
ncbi:hypothetical protein VE00_03077 [Pseudogymnoascus sp. WSF 3629]|nr:hypothetical protein VE00_03077 [Pseudogymnoascus sp. WSF 3629]